MKNPHESYSWHKIMVFVINKSLHPRKLHNIFLRAAYSFPYVSVVWMTY